MSFSLSNGTDFRVCCQSKLGIVRLSLVMGWESFRVLFSFGVHCKRSLGEQLSFSLRSSIWSRRLIRVALFIIEFAVWEEKPAFTRKLKGFSIPLALNMGSKLNVNIG